MKDNQLLTLCMQLSKKAHPNHIQLKLNSEARQSTRHSAQNQPQSLLVFPDLNIHQRRVVCSYSKQKLLDSSNSNYTIRTPRFTCNTKNTHWHWTIHLGNSRTNYDPKQSFTIPSLSTIIPDHGYVLHIMVVVLPWRSNMILTHH